ncbi:hypothetical protein HYZ64_03960 [Candidatus Berkelbacteria bacterium]|nr:hypothetical protein [Candidatus Berkelbacteria bacterium]
MELRDYIRIILKQKLIVLAIAIMLGAAGYLSTARQAPTVDGSVTFTVVNSERFPANQYGYDYYFTIQSSSLLADTIDGWFGSPNFVAKVYNSANVALPSDNTRAAGRIFKSVKEIEKSPIIVISIKTNDRAETEKIIKAAADVTNQEITELVKLGKLPNTFSVLASDPLILESKPKPELTGIVGLVVGLILGCVIALGKHYFTEG